MPNSHSHILSPLSPAQPTFLTTHTLTRVVLNDLSQVMCSKGLECLLVRRPQVVGEHQGCVHHTTVDHLTAGIKDSATMATRA